MLRGSARKASGAFASLDPMADHVLDTASQRSATGLDQGARQLILHVLSDARADLGEPLMWLCKDRFGSLPDYYAAVEEVWGYQAARICEQAKNDAELNAEFSLNYMQRDKAGRFGLQALLLAMPEPDFRLAVEL